MAKNKKVVSTSTWTLIPDSERQILALHRIADSIGQLMLVVSFIGFLHALIKLVEVW